MNERKPRRKISKYFLVTIISLSIFFVVYLFYYFLPNSSYKISGLDFVNLAISSIEDKSVNLRFIFKTWISGLYSLKPGMYSSQSNRTIDKGIFNKIYIAAIDDASIDEYGGTYPYKRQVYADILNYYNSLPVDSIPQIIFFDIIFAEPSQYPESDRAFFEAIRDYKRMVGEDIILDIFQTELNIENVAENSSLTNKEFLELWKKRYLKEGIPYTNDNVQQLRKFEIHTDSSSGSIKKYQKTITMMAEISKNLAFAGSANVDTADNKKIPFIVRSDYYDIINNDLTNIYADYPSVILSMAARLLGSDNSKIRAESNRIVIPDATYNGKKMDFDIPVGKQYLFNVNFKSNPGSGYVNVISLKDLTNTVLPRDAIVFVGMYTESGPHDIKASPYGDMFGVELNAYALGTVLERNFLRNVPDWIGILYLFVLSVLIGILVAGGSRTTMIAGIFAVVIPVITGITFFMFNYIIITFVPIFTAVLSLFSVQLFILLTEQKEKKFIKNTFSSYLNPKLVDILIQNPDMLHLGGEGKEITVFFSAIKGLEHISENLNPKMLISYLNDYFSRMADIVVNTSGTLDKYIGDAVMAFWNAPIDIPDHALKACQASVKMLETLKQFNEDQGKKGYKPIQIHIGINTGNIIVGNVGSEQQKNYTAIGDAVNLASRVKGLNKFFHTNIVISEFTYNLVKDFVIARELDLTKVKGKNEPVRIYELLDVTKWD